VARLDLVTGVFVAVEVVVVVALLAAWFRDRIVSLGLIFLWKDGDVWASSRASWWRRKNGKLMKLFRRADPFRSMFRVVSLERKKVNIFVFQRLYRSMPNKKIFKEKFTMGREFQN
jgi:hypothetical protein